ncbi:RND efflux system outer membrane lipoprotein NodT [Moraxella macacae 0408225]|uniref:RND efflux system outer membrane lipoprotein NodT n=1 Tax=Moraxella macacae 0408225 TaxID=1230338 RepID=L2F547_9GAMM|nr:TolC family protein [Moraxella macacae]ELA08025.1 RND efflux system outer membrane lipoprotein NodT [Moraxella macacae 0408225]
MQKQLLNPLKIGSLTALFISFTACQAIPKANTDPVIAKPNIATNTPYHVYDDKTLSSSDQPSIASQHWQDFYHDDKLKQLITLALDNNKEINTAILNLQKSRATYQITDNSNTPTVGATGIVNHSTIENQDKNPRTNYQINLAMSAYEFDFWGKIRNTKQAALQNYLSSAFAKDTVKIGIISSVAKSYVAYSYNLAKLQLALETLKNREESLQINRQRFKAGLDSELSSLQAQALVDATKISIANAKTALLQNQNALRQLVGVAFDPELLPKTPVSKITNNQIFSTGLPSELLLYRPDLRSAEHALKARGADIQVARANFFPNIRLSATTGIASTELHNLFASGTFNFGITPTINLPIFNRNLGVQYEVKKIDEQIMLSNYEKSIQSAFKEVNDILAIRATIHQQIDAYKSMKQANDKNFDIANARFHTGLDNYLSVLDALRNQFSTEHNLLTAKQKLIDSQIELYQALGGGMGYDQKPKFEKQAN